MSPKDSSSSQMITPEFSRRIALSRLGRTTEEKIEAHEQEREKLCQRFGLLGLDRLTCQYRLIPGDGDHIEARGSLYAEATQACVITGEAVPEIVKEDFLLRFVPQADIPDDEELDIDELLADEADDVPHDGRAIDLGEATAEQLSLALNPYPRRAGAGLEQFVEVTPPEGEEDVPRDEKPNPFAALAKLKEKRDEQ